MTIKSLHQWGVNLYFEPTINWIIPSIPKDVLELVKESGSKLKIKEDEIDFRVLEGQEETIYLRKEHKRMKTKRNREHAKARKRKEKNYRDSQTFIEVVGKRRFHPCFNFWFFGCGEHFLYFYTNVTCFRLKFLRK